jgi:hypothetical protein
VLLYLLHIWHPPSGLWKQLLRPVRASREPQRLYPRIGAVLRTLHLAKRALGHMRWMDFSIMPGWIGYFCWRIGLTGFWWKHLTPRMPRPERPEKWEQRIAMTRGAPSAPDATLVISKVEPSQGA